jgi:hypothetical protein
MIFRFLTALALLAPCLLLAAPQVLLDAATGQPKGFSPPPALATEQGATTWRGPAEWKIPARDGIFTISFRFLGYQSTRQEDLIVLLSGAPDPLAIVRNVNSSARLKSNGRHLISGPSGRYQMDHWHELTLVYHSGKGTLTVTCDGKPKMDEPVTAEGTRFAGLRFSKSAALSGLRITHAPLPEPSPEERRLTATRAELAKKILALPAATIEASRQRAVLHYHLDQLDRALLQDALPAAADIAADIAHGLRHPMGRMAPDQVWLRPPAQATNNPWLCPEFHDSWFRDWLTSTHENWKVSNPQTYPCKLKGSSLMIRNLGEASPASDRSSFFGCRGLFSFAACGSHRTAGTHAKSLIQNGVALRFPPQSLTHASRPNRKKPPWFPKTAF